MKRNAFSLQQNEAVLVALRMSELRELKNLILHRKLKEEKPFNLFIFKNIGLRRMS